MRVIARVSSSQDVNAVTTRLRDRPPSGGSVVGGALRLPMYSHVIPEVRKLNRATYPSLTPPFPEKSSGPLDDRKASAAPKYRSA